jgi:hypothetical protein
MAQISESEIIVDQEAQGFISLDSFRGITQALIGLRNKFVDPLSRLNDKDRRFVKETEEIVKNRLHSNNSSKN